MREIKFRAWDGQKMVQLTLMELQYEHNSNPCLYEDKAGSSGLLHYSDCHPMQYTGLKDKHGTEIYEGDIVNIALWDGNDWEWEEGVIKWYEPSSAFKWFSLEEDPSDANNYWLSQADGQQRQVIGNVYENPELLKEGDRE